MSDDKTPIGRPVEFAKNMQKILSDTEDVVSPLTRIDRLNRLGPALRLIRLGAGLTLGDLADGLGVDVVILSALERGTYTACVYCSGPAIGTVCQRCRQGAAR